VHEQTAIACEDCSILGGHDLEKATIVGLRFVGAVQSEESEVAGKPTEMSIDDKAFAAPPLQARLWGKNILRCGESIDVDPRGCFDLPPEVSGLWDGNIRASDSDEVDLRVRNPASLNYIFNGRLFRQTPENTSVGPQSRG
jgi:hypothetical protein